jgi:hypothetical protein
MILYCNKENGKLYFGRVTFASWIRAFFGTSGQMLEVKPLRGYEDYHYFKGHQTLYVSPNYGLLANDFYSQRLSNIKDLPKYLNYLYEEQAKRFEKN